jgi:thiol:disulfide interchange protein
MRSLFAVLLLACFAPVSLLAQTAAKPTPVTVSLLSEHSTVAPGKEFRVAAKLVHQPTFHTYGKTLPEGVVGKPTVLKWTVPDGWKVEDLPWPKTHETESTGGAKTQGYDGTVYLPAKVTPPANAAVGSTVKIEVAVDALVCDPASCMPFNKTISLDLTVGDSPVVDPKASEAFKPYKVSLVSEHSTVAPGQSFRAAIRIDLDPHYHIYAKTIPEGATALPTELTWKLPDGWKSEDIDWPATKEFKSTDGKTVPGYEGTVFLPAKITPPANLTSTGAAPLEATVDMLVCKDDECLRATDLKASLDLKLGSSAVADTAVTKLIDTALAGDTTAKGAATTAAPQQGIATLLLFAFIGGLILNVMPCVFPVLAIKILGFVNQAGEDKRHVFHHGLAYTAGVMLSMWTLGALVVTIGLSWGGQLQSPVANLVLAAFFLIFGLNMAGVFEIGTSAVGVGSGLQARSGLQGSFFSGLLATIVATPCAAPFLSVALAATLSLPAAHSMLIFTFIGLGLSAPYFLLSIFPKLVRLLPRPGVWMETFKQAMSFLLFATVAYFIWVLAAMLEDYGLLRALFALVLVAVACWIYGRWCSPIKPRSTRVAALTFSIVFLVSALTLGWPAPRTAASEVAGSGLSWEKWSAETVKTLRDERKPVYIDFTARWCVTCQTNKVVYNSTELQEQFKKRGVVTLKADYTNEDPAIKEALRALDRAAVPVNVLYVPGREDPVILPNILTVSNVTAALSEIDKASPSEPSKTAANSQ